MEWNSLFDKSGMAISTNPKQGGKSPTRGFRLKDIAQKIIRQPVSSKK